MNDATANRRRRWMLAVVLIAAVGAGIAASGLARAAVSNGASTGAATADTSTSWVTSPLISQFANSQGISQLSVLVSAGSGSTSSAVIVGSNAAGDSCWTLAYAMGGLGGPFRCGMPLGAAPGAPDAADVVRLYCETSGDATSTTPTSASCIGFLSANAASVQVKLAGGSTQAVTVTNGAFAYQADTPGELPTAVVAYDSGGGVVAQKNVVLAQGPGNG